MARLDSENEKLYLTRAFHRGGYRYIAANKDGTVYLYHNKPFKDLKNWIGINGYDVTFYSNFGARWRDEEPLEIKKLI